MKKMILVGTIATLGCAWLGIPSAGADTAMHADAVNVCAALDKDATTDGFRKALLPVVLRNVPVDDVVAMLDYAVTDVCPWHGADLARAADELQGRQKMSNGIGAHAI